MNSDNPQGGPAGSPFAAQGLGYPLDPSLQDNSDWDSPQFQPTSSYHHQQSSFQNPLPSQSYHPSAYHGLQSFGQNAYQSDLGGYYQGPPEAFGVHQYPPAQYHQNSYADPASHFNQTPEQQYSTISPQQLQGYHESPQNLSAAVHDPTHFQPAAYDQAQFQSPSYDQQWDSNPAETHPIAFDTPAHQGQEFLTDSPNLPVLGTVGPPQETELSQPIEANVSGSKRSVNTQAKRTTLKRESTEPRSHQVRITHENLLTEALKDPTRGAIHAPFVVFDTQPMRNVINRKSQDISDIDHWLESSLHTKTPTVKNPPKYIPRLGKSGKLLVPDLKVTGAKGDRQNGAAILPPPKPKSASISKVAGSKVNKLAQTNAVVASSPRSNISSPADASSPEDQSQSDSESGSEDMDTDTPRGRLLKAIRSDIRPEGKIEAAEWDAIGIVAYPKSARFKNEELTASLKDFWALIEGGRDDLKNLNDELEKVNSRIEKLKGGAETKDQATAALAEKQIKKYSDEAIKLSEKMSVIRKVMAAVLNAFTEHGHETMVSSIHAHGRAMAGLATLLINAAKRKDFTGELPRAIFRLLTKIRLNDATLEKMRYKKMVERFEKSTDSEIKAFIRQIDKNVAAAEATKKNDGSKSVEAKREAALLGAQEKIEAQKNTDASKSSQQPSGIKRSRESDVNANTPNKKLASETTRIGTQKPVPTKVTPTERGTTSVFASLKRPASRLQQPAAPPAKPAITAPVKVEKPKTPQPPVKSQLASILDLIEKPKSPPKKVESPARAPETPEEKAKRERKESRRHLRVSWKTGSELEQVRLFTHERAEDEGRQGEMLRDAHDNHSEGMMHKQRAQELIMDDDEDEYDPEEAFAPQWPAELSLTDFSALGEERLQKNLVTRGGQVTFTTPEQTEQERRESRELMVIYTDPNDIPPSPKEPPIENADSNVTVTEFGQPKADWLLQRFQDVRNYGADNAYTLLIRRLEENQFRKNRERGLESSDAADVKSCLASGNQDVTSILNAMKNMKPVAPPQPQVPTAATDQARDILARLRAAKPELFQQPTQQGSQQQSQPQSNASAVATSENVVSSKPAPSTAELVANLERIIAPIKGKPYPPTEPPEWMSEHGKAMWWEGYNRDKQKKLEAERRAAEAQAQLYAPQMNASTIQSHMQAQVQPPGYPSQPSVQAPTQQYDLSQLQNILANLNPAQASQAQTAQAQASVSQADPQAAYLQAYAQAYPQALQDPTFLRAWANASQNSGTQQTYAPQAQYQAQQAQYQAQQPQYQPPQQTRWDNENRGNDTGRHGPSHSGHDHSKKHNTHGWDGTHGSEERRRDPRGDPSVYNAKTKPCKFWQEGKCAKGDKCTYRHD